MRRIALVQLVSCCRARRAGGRARTADAEPRLRRRRRRSRPRQRRRAANGQPRPTPALKQSRSLFEPTWHQFQFGGRLDQYRWRPGAIPALPGRAGRRAVHRRRGIASEDPNGLWLFRASADNVGWRDQRYFADYERDRQASSSRASGIRSRSSTAWTPRRLTLMRPVTRWFSMTPCSRAIQSGQANRSTPTCRSRRSSISRSGATSARSNFHGDAHPGAST